MADLNMTSIDPVLKTLYKGQRVAQSMYKKFQLFAVMPKAEGFVGRNMPIPVQYGDGGGRSVVFANTRTYSQAPQFEDFLLTRVSDYARGSISGEAIEAAASDRGSFVRGLKAVVDSKLRELVRSLAIALFRDGSGYIGQVGAWTSPNVYATLKNINDIANFEVYDEIEAAATKTGTIRSGSTTLVGIDRSSGKITSDTALGSDITGFAVDDYLFVKGDAQNGGAAVKVSGLEAWVPSSAPSSTAFFGVDRTADSRLGGLRLDASSYSLIQEAIIDACSMIAAEGGAPDLFVLHPVKFRKLIKELGSKVEYDKLSAQGPKGDVAHIGFRTVVLDGPTGPVKVLQDRHCPSDVSWALQMDTWKLHTLGSVPRFLMQDGNRILRQDNADGYELRVGYRGQLACNAPGWNCHVTLP